MLHKRFTLHGKTYFFCDWETEEQTAAFAETAPGGIVKRFTAEQLKDAVFETDEEHLAWLKQRSKEILAQCQTRSSGKD